jgi:transcriptional regulator with XRE-family HTH domain
MAVDDLEEALVADSAKECAQKLATRPERFAVFSESLPHAIQGEWAAVQVVVNRWHGLLGDLLEAAANRAPQLVTRVDDHLGIRTAAQQASDEPVNYLEHFICDIPFSPMVASYGPGIGVGVAAVDALRGLLPGWSRLRTETSLGWAPWEYGSNQVRYRRLVEIALRYSQPPLNQVRDMFDLTNTEFADLFGVTRQAIEQWERVGDVPAARRARLANLLSVGEILERKLQPGRLPLIARRPAAAYGGQTMLEMVRVGRDQELKEITERALDWSTTA